MALNYSVSARQFNTASVREILTDYRHQWWKDLKYLWGGVTKVVVDNLTTRSRRFSVIHALSTDQPVGRPSQCGRRLSLPPAFGLRRLKVDGDHKDGQRHGQIDNKHDEQKRVATARHGRLLPDRCAIHVERLTGRQVMTLIYRTVTTPYSHSHPRSQIPTRIQSRAFRCFWLFNDHHSVYRLSWQQYSSTR